MLGLFISLAPLLTYYQVLSKYQILFSMSSKTKTKRNKQNNNTKLYIFYLKREVCIKYEKMSFSIVKKIECIHDTLMISFPSVIKFSSLLFKRWSKDQELHHWASLETQIARFQQSPPQMRNPILTKSLGDSEHIVV